MRRADWLSERIIFGFLIIAGYFAMGGIAVFCIPEKDANAWSLTHDVLLTVGPLLGMIAQAIWKADKTDRQNATTAATLASKAPDLSGTAATVNPAEGTTS